MSRRRKKESGPDELFKFLVGVPWWVGPILAALVFIGFRAILPAILSSSVDPTDAGMKTFTTTLTTLSQKFAPIASLGVIFIWGIAEVKKFADRRRLDRQTGLESIGDLSWREFEGLTAEALRRQGYDVEVTGNPAGDGGVDVVARRKGQTTLVQCKHWKTWKVDVKIVRELRGVMAAERAEYGIIVTYGAFTADAEAFAKENRITLIGGNDLVQMIRSVQRKSRVPVGAAEALAAGERPQPTATVVSQEAPSCPRCGTAMRLRTSKRGANAGSQFWGCPRFPACQGTRPI